jgi:D-3-phosphoglycerate dehydrogenase / 2-oxoglutarate reductase
MKVLISAALLWRLRGEFLDVLAEGGFEPVYPSAAKLLTEDELLSLLPGVAATLCGSEPYARRLMEQCPGLRVIARLGVGYDAVDVQAATEHGVAVTIAAGANQEAVAEHTFALMLALAKNVVPHYQQIRAGRWPRQPNSPLRGMALGIVGLGRTGKAVALRAEVFGMRLLAHEKIPDTAFVQQHRVMLLPLDSLFAQADILSLHVPYTAETRHLVNQCTLQLMKPGALLINTARGALVCESDLVECLRARRIAGAGLDVLEVEPPQSDNPILTLDNVVFTPHTAGVDLRSRDDMALSAARSIAALSRGDWPAEQIVNPQVRERFHW